MCVRERHMDRGRKLRLFIRERKTQLVCMLYVQEEELEFSSLVYRDLAIMSG